MVYMNFNMRWVHGYLITAVCMWLSPTYCCQFKGLNDSVSRLRFKQGQHGVGFFPLRPCKISENPKPNKITKEAYANTGFYYN